MKTSRMFLSLALALASLLSASESAVAQNNTPPSLGLIADQTTPEDVPLLLSATVYDDETPATSLVVTGTSANQILVPNANILFGGSGSNRTVQITPSLNQIGTTRITLRVTDGGGLFAEASFWLTVSNFPPLTLTCSSNKTVQCSTAWNFDPPTALGGCCSNVTVTILNTQTNPGPCLSTFTRTWRATDCCTNVICSQTVTVVDTTAPGFSYCPSNKTVQCGTNWTFDTPTAFDTCCVSNPVITVLSTTGSFISSCQSNYTRIWLATDCCGNNNSFCIQTVFVVNTTPPVITCASNKTIECGATLTFDPPTAEDACCPSNSLTPQFLGSNLVSSNLCQKVWEGLWQVSDCCSNYSAICTQLVTVVDTTPPMPVCANLTFNCTQPGGRIVDFTLSATDNCDPNPAVTSSPLSGSFFPVGVTPVTVTATDACGLSNSCTFTVTVLSNCPPACVTSPTNLVAWWQAESNALDAVGGYHGTLQGAATFAVGKVGQAFSFDGANSSYVSVPDSPAWDFGLNDFTLELWTKLNVVKDSMFIHQQNGAGSGGFEFDFLPAYLGGSLLFARTPFDVGILRPWTASPDIWYHLAVTRQAGTYRLYVDGVQLGAEGADPNPVANVTGPLRIGSWSDGGGLGVNGRIDELSIYSRALSAAELLAIVNAGGAGKCPTNCLLISCPGTNLIAYACETNGAIVPYFVHAANLCNPTNYYVVCEPPPNSWFGLGTTPVNCWVYEINGGQSKHCSFTVTVVSNCPPGCLSIVSCPDDITMPCASILGTPLSWSFEAVNTCNPGYISNWCEPPSGFPFPPGITPVVCYASNTLSGEVITCEFTVNLFIPAPTVGIRRGGGSFGVPDQIVLGWEERCDHFGPQWTPGLGSSGAGPGWSPFGDVTIAHWSRTNPTNNAIDRVLALDFPVPTGDPAPNKSFFQLTDRPGIGMDFSTQLQGVFTNELPLPADLPVPDYIFSRMGGGQMHVISLNNQNVLKVDDSGIKISMPTNNPTGSNLLTGGLNLHEISLGLVPNGDCLFVRAFDLNNQLVDARMATNAFESVTFRSHGVPFHRVEVVAETNEIGGILSINGLPRYSDTILSLAGCTNFNSFPTGAVANPLVLPGFTITARNAVGTPEATYIEAGPEGRGYHVQHTAEIVFGPTCCRRVDIELIQTSGLVDIIPYGASGARLDPHRLDSDSSGEVVTVVLGPYREPVCRVEVIAPNDLTRILSICCVPAETNTCLNLPDFPTGTNANPWTVGATTFERFGGPGYTTIVSYGGMNVLDLGTETLVTFAGDCARVLLEVISDGSGGMTFEVRNALGGLIRYEGPLPGSAVPQTVVLEGPGIKTVRIKPPPGNGYLVRICCLNE